MAGMTIENIGSWTQSGNVDEMMTHGRLQSTTPIQAPEIGDANVSSGNADNGDTSFMQALKNGLDKLNRVQQEADHATKEMLAGRNKNIHETMLMLEQADLAYKMTMQVRNKIIDAYREVMKMQI